MSHQLQRAKTSDAELYPEVRAYMPDLFMRIAFNYMTLFLVALLISFVLGNFLANFIWASTANTIAFVVNLGLLVYGWRWLENRNLATSLFISYTHYSKQRRELLKAIKLATAGTLDNLDELDTLVDLAVESGQQFLSLAQEHQMKRLEQEKQR